MNRDWLTLAFGIALVGGVVSLSLRQHAAPGAAREVAMAAEAPTEPPPTPTPSTAADSPAPARATKPGRERHPAPARKPAERDAAAAAASAPAPAAALAPAPLASAALSLPSVAPTAAPRYSASIPVVHRHAMGSCQGTLVATSRGIIFETEHKTDGFSLAFADIEEFEVEYVKKNLRLQRRGGRTWNFTNDSADGLFMFHRDVNKTRERLAAAAR